MSREHKHTGGWVPALASALVVSGALVGLGLSMVSPEALTWGTPLAAVLCVLGAVLFVVAA